MDAVKQRKETEKQRIKMEDWNEEQKILADLKILNEINS